MTRSTRYPEVIRAIDGNFFISADYILRTGSANGQFYGDLPIHVDLTVDLNRDSELKTHFDAVYANVMERMRTSPLVRGLLHVQTWTATTREMWEEGVARIVADEFRKNPFFHQYRDVPVTAADLYRSL